MTKRRTHGPAKRSEKRPVSGPATRRRQKLRFWELAGVSALAVLVAAVMMAFNAFGAGKVTGSPTVASTSGVVSVPTRALPSTPDPTGAAAKSTPSSVGATAKTLGSADAKVTIIEYADYQ